MAPGAIVSTEKPPVKNKAKQKTALAAEEIIKTDIENKNIDVIGTSKIDKKIYISVLSIKNGKLLKRDNYVYKLKDNSDYQYLFNDLLRYFSIIFPHSSALSLSIPKILAISEAIVSLSTSSLML